MAEKDLYGPIKEQLEKLLATKERGFHLEITAAKGLSEKLKAVIPNGREIVFTLKQRPDIFGYVAGKFIPDLVTVEVKVGRLKLEDIYQAKFYKEVLSARYGFLVTTESVPEELKRLCKNTRDILHSTSDSIYRVLAIGQFDEDKNEFVDWFEENPFEKDCYWK